ncbi:MAG: hypothetical protein H7195_00675 [Chryseobacterium sp.]|nr:hypothetical protein [Chryseobacterium sp.]
MKHFCFLLFFSVSLINAQKIDKNLFGNYEYQSKNKNFSADLKKDIFDNIIYTDNNNNEIIFEKKYVSKFIPGLFKNEGYSIQFFRTQIRTFANDNNYKQKFEIDILGKEIISDNRNNTSEAKTDIFGNYQYVDRYNNESTSISQDLHGNWNFKRGNQTASLEKNFNSTYTYKDSVNNILEINSAAFQKLKNKLGGEKEVFFFLIYHFLD